MSDGGAAGRRSLSDDVFGVLRDAVLDGTLEPGERLHDDELVAWLGVSRTPIRSALDRLCDAGLVELSANRYTRVREPDQAWLVGSAAAAAGLHRAAAGVLPVLDDACVDAVLARLAATRPVVARSAAGPASPAVLRCVGAAVGALAAWSPGAVLRSALDEAELRLAHGLRSRRCGVELGAWDAFVARAEVALRARDAAGWSEAVAELARRVVATATTASASGTGSAAADDPGSDTADDPGPGSWPDRAAGQ